jgi:rhodanese-related sulfurtransferase
VPNVAVVDLATSPLYRKAHIPDSAFIIRARIAADLPRLEASALVITSPDGVLAQFALGEAQAAFAGPVRVLLGGTAAWQAAGLPVVGTEPKFLSAPEDVYKRPYEGTDNAAAAMQAYIDWEHRLVAQLANDGVCRFRVV